MRVGAGWVGVGEIGGRVDVLVGKGVRVGERAVVDVGKSGVNVGIAVLVLVLVSGGIVAISVVVPTSDSDSVTGVQPMSDKQMMRYASHIFFSDFISSV